MSTDEKDPEPQGLKLPEPTVLIKPRQPDEEIPAFGAIRRVTYADQPQLTWVAARLTARSPTMAPDKWFNMLRGFMTNSAYFFQMSDHAVLLGQIALAPMSGRRFVAPLFLFEKERGAEGGHIGGSQSEKDALGLMRELASWGRHQGADEIRWIDGGGMFDLPIGVVTHRLGAEKRDEIVVRIR